MRFQHGSRHRRRGFLHELLVLSALLFSRAVCSAAFSLGSPAKTAESPSTTADANYDLIIIGAGASGLFATGAASALGSKTLLIDQVWRREDNNSSNTTERFVGGDCTNAACVPSKALRSVARMNGLSAQKEIYHVANVVNTVRRREDPSAIAQRNPNLDLVFVDNCQFQSSHELELVLPTDSGSFRAAGPSTRTVTAKHFVIATGSSPIVPKHLAETARWAGIPFYTYQSLLRPSSRESVLKSLSVNKQSVLVVGGGPTACELSQSLARLSIPVTIVAPAILPKEDVSLQRAAIQLLRRSNITLHLGRKAVNVTDQGQVLLSDGTMLTTDALLLCVGREPASLSKLNLSAANVRYSASHGVIVNPNTLQTSACHIFACGDCCAGVSPQCATQAAYTGFYAARNTRLPWILRVGSTAVHRTVPKVFYTDPELAVVGLSLTQCIQRYGEKGFDRLYVTEIGTDRADMEALERDVGIGFVEIRACCRSGKLLGFTACGPAAAECANEMGLAIVHRMTVRDVARALHSYPSHGYLMHRVALALATKDILGLLAACGPVGQMLGAIGRFGTGVGQVFSIPKNRGENGRRRREWQAEGAGKGLILLPSLSKSAETANVNPGDNVQVLSYLDVYKNNTLREELKLGSSNTAISCNHYSEYMLSRQDRERFHAWFQKQP